MSNPDVRPTSDVRAALGGRIPSCFSEFIHARRTGRDQFRLPNDKLWDRAAAERCGIALPALYGVFPAPVEIDFAALPERFVLKPISLSSGRGVLLLERSLDGRYLDAVSGELLSQESIVSVLEAALASFPRRPTKILAEEMVSGGAAGKIPIDYKFFTFGGEIRFIEHIDRNGPLSAIHLYQSDFSSLNIANKFVLNFRKVRYDQPRPPAWRGEMVDAVRKLARELRTPFVRIDLYAGEKGPVLGELTSTPGGAYFGTKYRLTPVEDSVLGQAWADAARALGQPLPKIKGQPPIHKIAKKTLTVNALAWRDLKSALEARQIEVRAARSKIRELEKRLAATSWRGRLVRFARAFWPSAATGKQRHRRR